MRVSIVGQGGSGKTYLASKLQRKYGVPVIHLDRIWMKHGGHTARSEKSRRLVRKKLKADVRILIEQPDWVCEGFYGRLEPMIIDRADLVLHLPRPLPVRVFNHLSRTIRKSNRHPEIKWHSDIAHTVTLVKKSPKQKAELNKVLSAVADKTIHLPSRQAVDLFVNRLPNAFDDLRGI